MPAIDNRPAMEMPIVPPANTADVVIVGAGPVGLWTSILIRAMDPDVKVSIIDKYKEYKRDNPLDLSRSSFAGIPKDARVQDIVDEIFTKDGKSVSSIKINTNRIEDILLKAAIKMGVDIQRGPENEIKTIYDLQRFPNARIIVGADGAKSKIREQVFGDLEKDEDLQYIAQAKYKTGVSKPKPTQQLKALKMMSRADAFVTENPRNPKEGDEQGSMNLLVTVSQKTFNKIREATFKAPFTLSQCPKKLQSKIRLWMNARAEKDQKPEDSKIEVSSIRLSSYKSKEFVKVVDDNKGRKLAVALVGDAAFGVPYFRSLNNGIACAIKFAKACHAEQTQKRDINAAMKKYNSFVSKLAGWEMFKAKVKSLAVRALGAYIHVVGWIPRQVKSAYESYLNSSSSEYS